MKIVVLGDLHEPWSDTRAVARAVELCQGATEIVQIGDLYDFLCFSRYARTHNEYTPKQELDLARKRAEATWQAIRATAPRAKRFQLKGNHDERLSKRVLERFPEVEGLVKGVWDFPGVETVEDASQELEVRGILFQHGHRSKLGDHAKWNQCSTVVGHSHVGGVVYGRNRAGVYWELNAGFLGDLRAPCFRYRTERILTQWTVGAGIIDDLGPRFVPFQ